MRHNLIRMSLCVAAICVFPMTTHLKAWATPVPGKICSMQLGCSSPCKTNGNASVKVVGIVSWGCYPDVPGSECDVPQPPQKVICGHLYQYNQANCEGPVVAIWGQKWNMCD